MGGGGGIKCTLELWIYMYLINTLLELILYKTILLGRPQPQNNVFPGQFLLVCSGLPMLTNQKSDSRKYIC